MIVYAHRGAHGPGRPENSAAALAAAADEGWGVESDIRRSRDGVPVLMHDPLMWRRGPVWPRVMSARQLARHEVPTLASVLERPGVPLCLDLKVVGVFDAVVALVRELSATDRVRLVHDDLDVLAQLHQRAPDLRLIHEAPVSSIGEHPAYLHNLARIGVTGQNTGADWWTRDAVRAAHDLGIEAHGSLVNDAQRLAHGRAVGLDGLCTDRLDLAAEHAQGCSASNSASAAASSSTSRRR
ncbi:glycerophosphodiester phosphodiesterase [Calidifontibacter sp. DB0510]|uniref:Glycerophosphodiester phosphodiesterase n=1 Tax=Metallococcus carri TaxID=1656884 RepID=A0A967B2G2_9MICO|nr:glycerophosphodiester phosphodiesterase [Metallococcus carri]NHN56782.1 glycerophosphodiester phosphodiesterase [Metallococcus carri]NOP37841.1 glycerophosphodiester phosphodiesterase [Calidifontibacter sp. DB2511S]